MEDYSPLIAGVASLIAVNAARPEDAAAVEELRQQLQVAIDTLIIYVDNVLKNMGEPKFRKVKKAHPAFERRIGSVPRAKAAFHLLGWQDGPKGTEDEEFYVLEVTPANQEAVEKRLHFARGELERIKQELLQSGPRFIDPAAATAPQGGDGTGVTELGQLFPHLEGVRFRLPADWVFIKVEPTRGLAVFKSLELNLGVVLNYLPQPLQRAWLDEASLDFYRHNLRLHAAHNKGGLVECDLYPGGYVAGITKRAQPEEYAGGRGITYQLHLLIPAKQGVISALIFADEGKQTGLREALMMAIREKDQANAGGDGGADWFADPYGYPLPTRAPTARDAALNAPFTTMEAQEMDTSGQAASEDEWFNPWRDIVYPRSKADDQEHDRAFAFHPLSRVREALRRLAECVEVAPEVRAACTPDDNQPQRVHIIDDVHCLIPPRFTHMPAPNMTHGKVFIRSGFESTLEVCNVTLQPSFPDCGRSLEAAKAITRQHVEWGHLQVLRGPVVKPGMVADRQGMINEAESMLNGKPVYTIAFYTPWGAEGSLEVSAVTQQGNHEEARQRLTAIVASLESRS